MPPVHDYVISNASGSSVRQDINNALAAIVSNNSNATSPSTTYAYQWWADTTTGQLKLRNSANSAWITIFELDGTMLMEDGSAGSPALAFASDLDTGVFTPTTNSLGIATGGVERLRLGSFGAVFNEGSSDVDFRVESNNNAHALFVDGGTDCVGIGVSNPGDFSTKAETLVLAKAGDHVGITLDCDTDKEGSIFFADGASGSNLFRGQVVYNHDGDSLRFVTNASERMRIDSSGNLGIGASSPAAKLDVAGNQIFTAASPQIQFNAGGPIIRLPAANTLAFLSDSSTERVRINSSGNLGIGTDNPESLLEISRSTADDNTDLRIKNFRPGIRFVDASSSTADGEIVMDGGAMRFRISEETNASTALTEKLRVDSSGRLLVGTSSVVFDSPSATIQQASSGGSQIILASSNTSGMIAGEDMGLIRFFSNAGSTYERGAEIKAEADGTQGSGDKPTRLLFSTTADGASSPTERMRIDSDGRVKFGTTSDTPHTLTSGTGAIFSDGQILQIGRDAVNCVLNRHTSNGEILRFNRQGVDVGSIDVTTTATSYNTSSDHRLKENVVDLDGAIDRVKQLAPKRFNFIADADTTVDGFLAHEAQTVVPEAVTGTHNEVDGDDNPVYQGIDQSKLVPLLTAALQEAIAKIETLETKVAALEAG